MLSNKLIFGNVRNLLTILLLTSSIARANAPLSLIGGQILCDYQHYYSATGLSQQLIGLGLAGLAANTHIDQGFQDEWQQHLRGNTTNRLSDIFDDYGEITQYKISIPIYVFLIGIEAAYPQQPLARCLGFFGNHALRTLLVGAPQQVALTHLLGGGRPQIEQSQWHLFKHQRAVSGHAFYGAIPFINLAKQTQLPLIKTSYYVLSTFPGLARINNNKHYFSQSLLGWWIAFSAANAVWKTEEVSKKPYTWSLQLRPYSDGIYLGLEAKL